MPTPSPTLTQEEQSAIDAGKAQILGIVNSHLTEREPEIAAAVKQALTGEFITPADAAAQIKQARDEAFAAINDLNTRLTEERGRRWDDSDDRFRFQSGAFDGVGIEMLEPIAFVGQHRKNPIDPGALTQGLKAFAESPRDHAEAHFAALKEKLGGVRNPIIDALENQALGRENLFTEPADMLNMFGGRFIAQANEITTTEAAGVIQPTLDATLWADMMLMPGVLPRIPQQAMPTQQHTVPNFDDVLRDALNDGTTMTIAQGETTAQENIDTILRQTTFNARTITLATAITQQAREDSVINLAGEVRDRMIQAGQYGLENFIINSDPTGAATAANGASGNINASAAANTLTRLGATGIRAWCIGNSERQRNAGGDAITNADIQAARAVLIDVGTQPGGYFYAMPASTYFAVQAVDEFARYDAAGQIASLLAQVPTLPGMGSPVVVSPGMAQMVTASGRKSGTQANNTMGHMLLVVPQPLAAGRPRPLPTLLGGGRT